MLGNIFLQLLLIIDKINFLDNTGQDNESEIFYEAAETLIPEYPAIPENIDLHPDLSKLMQKCWEKNSDQRPDASLARKITDATLKMHVLSILKISGVKFFW